MRFHVKFCFAIDLVTAGEAGHEYPKQQWQNSTHSICLLQVIFCCLLQFLDSEFGLWSLNFFESKFSLDTQILQQCNVLLTMILTLQSDIHQSVIYFPLFVMDIQIIQVLNVNLIRIELSFCCIPFFLIAKSGVCCCLFGWEGQLIFHFTCNEKSIFFFRFVIKTRGRPADLLTNQTV